MFHHCTCRHSGLKALLEQARALASHTTDGDVSKIKVLAQWCHVHCKLALWWWEGGQQVTVGSSNLLSGRAQLREFNVTIRSANVADHLEAALTDAALGVRGDVQLPPPQGDTLEGTLAAVLAPKCSISSEAAAVVAASLLEAARSSSTPCTVRGCEEQQQQQHGTGCLVLHAEHCDGVVEALRKWKGQRRLFANEAAARRGALRALQNWFATEGYAQQPAVVIAKCIHSPPAAITTAAADTLEGTLAAVLAPGAAATTPTAAAGVKVNPKITACPHTTATQKALGMCRPCYVADLARRRASKRKPDQSAESPPSGRHSTRQSSKAARVAAASTASTVTGGNASATATPGGAGECVLVSLLCHSCL
jgi:hypothetical protein